MLGTADGRKQNYKWSTEIYGDYSQPKRSIIRARSMKNMWSGSFSFGPAVQHPPQRCRACFSVWGTTPHFAGLFPPAAHKWADHSISGISGISGTSHVNVNRKTVPPILPASTVNSPPCALTILRQIDKPSPMPLPLVLVNGLKRLSTTAGAIPGPVSAIETSTLSSLCSRVRISIRRTGESCIASIALRIKLTMTCWI